MGVNFNVLNSNVAANTKALAAATPGSSVPSGPLPTSFPDESAFDIAVRDYTGPEEVDLNGTKVRDGTSPALTYFTNPVDGTISTTKPA